MRDEMELMVKLEGMREIAYDCTAGKRTIGIGFNMEAHGARNTWAKLGIPEDFVRVFEKQEKLSKESAIKLFDKTWKWCNKKAMQRCEQLEVDYSKLPDWHKFVLADIVYQTGNINNWTQVVLNTTPKEVLFQARRKQTIIDSRISKTGYYFGLINTLEEAHEIGLTEARYLV